MSGGFFDYLQYRFNDVAIMVDELVAINNQENLVAYDQPYPDDIISKFKETAKICRLAGAMAQRVDWLVSGDDGEESFRERWDEEVEPLR